MKMRTGKFLAKFYNLGVRSAYCHNEGNWYWTLCEFPAAYFDADGCVVFQSEKDYWECVYLSVGPRNTGVRNKNAGMRISDIPGYRRLDPPPSSL
jgi:hypothetical protein